MNMEDDLLDESASRFCPRCLDYVYAEEDCGFWCERCQVTLPWPSTLTIGELGLAKQRQQVELRRAYADGLLLPGLSALRTRP